MRRPCMSRMGHVGMGWSQDVRGIKKDCLAIGFAFDHSKSILIITFAAISQPYNL